MDNIIAQCLGIIVSIAAIVSMQLKNVRMILVCQLICNTVGAASYLLLDATSGGGIYFIALAQTIIYYVVRAKGKKAPIALAVFFVCAYLACSVSTFHSYPDIFSAIAATTCALALAQEKASVYRIFMFINGIIWTVYDVSMGAYTMIISHAVTSISSLVGMIRLDIKK